MKKQFKIYILWLVAIIAFSACSSIKKLPATVAGASRARFVGSWQLTKVSYDGLLPGSVQTILDQAPPEGFNASTWNLTNSGNGSYTLSSGISQTIFWSYDNSNGELFQFKKLYQGDSAKKVQEGYQLILASIDANNMTLKLPVSIGDKTAYVVLSFYRIK
ncbi:hypothetical protein HDF24_21840 [Mucilaginibacter sp. X4EP1]|uniref:hypothetical protein n=1 Tax=Mucilaginibacter sp. X4EP1 TaxID=2723092 RepID=UPI0021699AF9|nr:hypothetical protein [Mucilaginibacter sp. X4EP1]MCS3812372.1 hypothetical protein [Mucilaginibacter sp. X4EP1]